MYCDEELTELHAEIQRGIEALSRLSGDARQDVRLRMSRAHAPTRPRPGRHRRRAGLTHTDPPPRVRVRGPPLCSASSS